MGFSYQDKILPPYGRILQAYQQESVHLQIPIWIYVGKSAKEDAFHEKRMGFMCSYLPYGEDFSRYKWPIEEQKIIVQDTGGMSNIDLKKFCIYLIKFNPRVIFIYSEEHPNELILPQGRSYNG